MVGRKRQVSRLIAKAAGFWESDAAEK